MSDTYSMVAGPVGRVKKLRKDVTAGFADAVQIVDSTGAAGLVPGTGATALGKAEDAAHASGDVGVMALAVRKDTPTALAGADGDYAPVEVDGNGRLWVRLPGSDVTNNVLKVSELRSIATPITATGQLLLGVGVLCSLTVSNSHATTAMTVDVYDNTSAANPKIGCQRIVPPGKTETFAYFVPYAVGVWVVFTGGTVAGCDATYRAVA